jgi:DNA-binding response OmpR family regulator
MKILIAEDERDVALLYKNALDRRNHQVMLAENGKICLDIYHKELEYMLSGSPISSIPFDAIILDHKMPKINGMDVAKEILAINPRQRIIFASAFVKETLATSIRELKQVAELLQKPFGINLLIDTLEDRNIYKELKKLNVDLEIIRAVNPTHEQISDLLTRLQRIQKGRSY